MDRLLVYYFQDIVMDELFIYMVKCLAVNGKIVVDSVVRYIVFKI